MTPRNKLRAHHRFKIDEIVEWEGERVCIINIARNLVRWGSINNCIVIHVIGDPKTHHYKLAFREPIHLHRIL